MNDERIAKLEAYIEQEDDLKMRIWGDYVKNKYDTYGSGTSTLIIIIMIIGFFIIGPISIVLGVIVIYIVTHQIRDAKLDKAMKGTGFDGKYKKIYRGVNYILSFFTATEKEINEMIDESVKMYQQSNRLLDEVLEKYQ